MQVYLRKAIKFPLKWPVKWNIMAGSVRGESLVIDDVINKRINTCQFTVDNVLNTPNVDIYSEVIISDNADTTRYFAGYITNVKHRIEGINKVWDISCQDYTILLDKAIVNEKYENKTDAYMLNNAFTKYLPEIDASTYVVIGKTHDWFLANRITLSQLVNDLAGAAGYDWYVDYNKNLRFFPKETNLAPFNISDTPDESTSYAAENLKYDKDAATLTNRIIVVGGYYLSDDTDFDKIPASGTQTDIQLPYVFGPPDGQTQILVYHNTGNDGAPTWTADTVGVDNIDALGVGGVTVLFNRDEKLLKFQTAPSELDKAVKVTARYRVPVLVRVRSEISYDTFGRWLDSKLVDPNLISRDSAMLAGKAKLVEYALAREVGSYTITDRDGLVSGQKQNIVNTLRGISGDYLLTRVRIKWLGGTVCQYDVSFGEYNPDLIDMIITLKNAAMPQEERREDEVLNELFEQIETLTLSESTDRHEDSWDGQVGRWIALPPTQSVGHHVEHERVTLSEADTLTEDITEAYVWQ